MTELQVRKDDLSTRRLVDTPDDQLTDNLNDGEIIVKIDCFSFTANNITYGVIGEQLGYWQFFPPHGDDTDGWGLIPVWGFADVVASKLDAIPAGERLFGYFPPATYLTMSPVSVAPERFIDGAAHRAKLPPGYNMYRRVAAEPGYHRKMDNEMMLLYPLHITSFCLYDLLKDNDAYGAQQIVILSASSKTSLGLAYGLKADANSPPVIALTSPRNLEFVESLLTYDQAIAYDALTEIDATKATTIVDMSGNGSVLGALHTHLGDNLKKCVNVGLTHWDEMGKGSGINKERSEFFFAPAHIQARIKDWGIGGFAEKSTKYMQQTALKSRAWLSIKTLNGLPELNHEFTNVLEGQMAPKDGLIVAMPD